ncbi:MAG TPA: hypothetical protein VM345_16260 [Acidimicrobiales bacterium]|nr:hypothetical protein [Acidimicrobiales bacterium]
MNAAAKLTAYGAVLAAVFAGAFAAGSAAEPVGLSNAEPVEHASMGQVARGLPGLAIAEDGYELVPATGTLAPGIPTPYEFAIVGEAGAVTRFDVEHTKRMHLIVVRRDFQGFIHDHPQMRADGTWSTTLTITEPGAYRVFADFVVDGDKHTLGADLFVPGDFTPVELPAPAHSADAGDGYQVELDGEVVAGGESELHFTVKHDGKVVTDIPDYLGAKGHLVALRAGDLAYLHTHADEDRLDFEADFPTAGDYRLFLQFEHDGAVRTASFTVTPQEQDR